MIRAETESALTKCLIESENYHEFLQKAFAVLKEVAGFSYASFARRAQFKARSYPRDVLLGKKRLTAKSLPRFAQALGLSSNQTEYFRLLVYLDEPDLSPRALSKEQITELIQDRQKKLRSKLVQNQVSKFPHTIYRMSEWPYVYAALGDGENGETLAGVSRRSGLPTATCRRILSEMEKYHLVGVKDEKYFAKSRNLFSVGLGSQNSFKDFFIKSLERARKATDNSFSSPECFFFASVYSVKRNQIPELKNRLRAVMEDYILKAEEAEGEDLITLVLGAWPRFLEKS